MPASSDSGRAFDVSKGVERVTQSVHGQLDILVINDEGRSNADDVSDRACAARIKEDTFAHAVADDFIRDSQCLRERRQGLAIGNDLDP